MFFDHKKVQRIKEQYPGGTRIRLHSMSGEADMPSGLMGTVDFVDDAGQLQMSWDNGRTLALVPGEDSFSVIRQPEPEQKSASPEQAQKQKPDAPLIGANGNIFNLMGIASRALQDADMREQADQMHCRITASGSYEEALNIIGEYVNFTEAERPDLSESETEQFGMKME